MKLAIKKTIVQALTLGKQLTANTEARKVLKAAHDAVIVELCESFEGTEYDEVKVALLPVVAEFYRVRVVDGETRSKGSKVMDASSANYEAAKKALQRLLAKMFEGDKKPTSNAEKLLAECGGNLALAIKMLTKASKSA